MIFTHFLRKFPGFLLPRNQLYDIDRTTGNKPQRKYDLDYGSVELDGVFAKGKVSVKKANIKWSLRSVEC